MTIKLFGSFASTSVRRVLVTLKEKKIPFEFIEVNMAKGDHKSAEFLAKNPFGVIPALDDDGFTLFESRAICRYLEAKYKTQGTQLIPDDVKELAIFEQGASMETSYFDQLASGLTYELFVKPVFFSVAADAARVKELSDKLATNLDVYDKILSKQDYIGGNKLTLADLFHLPYLAYFFQMEIGHLVTDRPHVKEWWNKVSALPSWKEVEQMNK